MNARPGYAGKPFSPAAALTALLLAGFMMRIWAVNFGLPYLYHADEPIVVNHALAYGSGDFNPHFFKIPPLVSYVLFAAYGLFYVTGRVLGWFADVAAFEALFHSDPTAFYLIGRILLGVLPGTLAILALYRLTVFHFNRHRALMAAFLLTVNFLHVRDSHYIYADIPLLLVMVLALNALFRLPHDDSTRRHLLCGAWIGLAVAVKYNGFALIAPYLFMSLACKPSAKLLVRWSVAGAAALLVFFLFNPFAFLDWKFFLQEAAMQNQANTGAGWSHHLTYSLAGSFGWPHLVFAVMGMAHLLIRFRQDGATGLKNAALFIFAASYYLLLVFKGQHYDRYVLPLVPPLCYFSAAAIDGLCTRMRSPKRRTGIILILLFALAGYPLIKSVLWVRLMAEKDTRTLAKEWIETHIPEGKRIGLDWDFYMPRLNFSPAQLHEKFGELDAAGDFSAARRRKIRHLLDTADEKTNYNLFFLAKDPAEPRFLFARPVLPYDIHALAARGIDYTVIVDTFRMDGPETFYEALRSKADPVARFSPYKKGTEVSYFDSQPITGGPFTWNELWNRKRNGQLLEVYKVKEPPI